MWNVTCLACGCLCDDIHVVVEEGRIVEAEQACPIGRAWFVAARSDSGIAPVSMDGRAIGRELAIDRASAILREARSPVVWGLSGSTVETVASALAIADRIGAVVEVAGGPGSASKLAAFQQVGQVSASLGEVKDRADVVVFWGVDSLTTHPRHWERYSVEPRGRFIPEGRAGRFVIVVDDRPTATSRQADLFLPIDRDRQAEALTILRALVRGVAVDPDRSRRSSGVPYPLLEALADRLKAARYGALFFDDVPAEPLLKLVRDLNDGRRFVALEMGSAGDHSGASSVLGWQAGAGSSVDFGLGYPRHLPGEATLESRLDSGQVDAVLIVADDPRSFLSADSVDRLSRIPTIVIGPDFPANSVRFAVARPGIESSGTVSRVDGVMLPLRPALGSSLPTDRAILEAIRRGLEVSGGEIGIGPQ